MKRLLAFLIGALLTGLVVKLVVDYFVWGAPPFVWWQAAILGGIIIGKIWAIYPEIGDKSHLCLSPF
jgi:hypothetical protein